uniref:C2H2-type domain-containing protein n=1 Tax=Anopheles atroparvus TaxID=41427 RepID=A0AAG5DJL2_ANOAO
MENYDDLSAPAADDGEYLECEESYEEIEEIVQEEVIGTTGMDDDPGAVYYCTPCGVEFYSVLEHLQQFHCDGPIVLDMVDTTRIEPKPGSLEPVAYRLEELMEECLLPESPSVEQHEDECFDTSDPETALDPVDQRTCLVCRTVFVSKQSLKMHMRMHTRDKRSVCTQMNSRMDRIRCAECGEIFSKEQSRQHAEYHRRKKNHLCLVCNKRFASNEVLLMHMQNHTSADTAEGNPRKESSLKRPRSDGKLPYPCQYCGKKFYRPYEKVEHERIHTGEKPFSCQICEKSFRVTYSLTLHMRTHLDSRPYTCELCQKSFSSNSVYTHHLHTHSNERKYECSFCGKTFKTLVHLTGHRKSHTRPFTCFVCSRPFSTLYGLRNHMQLHQQIDKLALACQICGATYGRRSALRDHHEEQHRSNDEFL